MTTGVGDRRPSWARIQRSGWTSVSRNGVERWGGDQKGHDQAGWNRPLGWLSIGLGVGAIAFPRKLAQLIGIRASDKSAYILRGVGLREIASGVGMLWQPYWQGWPWIRAVGDAMDLGLMQASRAGKRVRHQRRFNAAVATVAGLTAADMAAGKSLVMRRAADADQVRVSAAITVSRSVDEVYRMWRNFESFQRFMANVESVRVIDDRRSHWRVVGPAAGRVEWDAEIVDDDPNHRIAWRTLPGAEVTHAGSVELSATTGWRKGTEIRVELTYDPPAGGAGRMAAKLFGKEPEQELRGDLRRFKSMLEAGEVIVSDATLQGRSIKQRSAQPPDIREYASLQS
jgi:uncharacterized membrane protein